MHARYTSNGFDFHIDQYNSAPPFADFFPALAGVTGKPMWVFFANRGQAISSFGINDKNGSMLEFLPANKAYQATPTLGFRTFLRISGTTVFEPFRAGSPDSHQRMTIRPYELELHDRNVHAGLEVSVIYFGVPSESLPLMARRVIVKNITKHKQSLEAIDGLPRVVPWGMNDFLVKNMSRTLEAFAEVVNLEKGAPVYKLKIQPDDKPIIEWLHGGFFSCAFDQKGILPFIVDPSQVFGPDTTFEKPSFQKPSRQQLTSNIMPCAFSSVNFSLKPGESKTIDSYYGYVDIVAHADSFAAGIKAQPDYFEKKRQDMKKIFSDLIQKFGFRTDIETLNAYANMTFMDNVLRGGYPMSVTPKAPVVHVFSRKHGDMERDYNNFQVSATPYSQGNGNFRDVNQNRRQDLLLNPRVGTDNIDFFFNLLQLDGYNPLIIDPVKFAVPQDLLHRFELKVTEECRAEFDKLRRAPVLLGRLYEFIKTYSPDPLNVDNLFRDVLDACSVQRSVKHGEGFWVDHWIYNLDHLDQYLAVFPEKKQWLLYEKKDFTFYDSDHEVKPRREKYIVTKNNKLRQYHAVHVNQEKKALIASRKNDGHMVRTENGHGEVLKVNLFTKLLALAIVKTSTLDPFGVGLEMEADRPGWCDALNGLPGLFGSSTHEMFELKRLVRFILDEALPLSPNKTIDVPQEIYALLRQVEMALKGAGKSDFRSVWNKLALAREDFRAKTGMGVSGKTRTAKIVDIKHILQMCLHTLEIASKKAMDPKTGFPTSYFIYAFDSAKVDDGWRQFLEKLPWTQYRIPMFLEGAVHAMKGLPLPKAKKMVATVRKTELYDKKLGLYKLNGSLENQTTELGRIRAFSPGWLENESIFLHMHYKYLLEILKAGLTDVFLKEIKTGLIPFRDAASYGRPLYENSSFIASSSFPKVSDHGRGFVARLSGATAEFLNMVYFMFFGKNLFHLIEGQVVFSPKPSLPAEWFSKEGVSLSLFGVPITYLNPKKRNTFGPRAVHPVEYEWILDGRFHSHKGKYLPSDVSLSLREGRLEQLTILLG